MSPLTHGLNYRSACDPRKVRPRHHRHNSQRSRQLERFSPRQVGEAPKSACRVVLVARRLVTRFSKPSRHVAMVGNHESSGIGALPCN